MQQSKTQSIIESIINILIGFGRSEERRVGKEC